MLASSISMLFSSIVCVFLLLFAAQQVGCNHLQGQLHVRHLLLLESEFGSFSFFCNRKTQLLLAMGTSVDCFTDLEDTDHLDPFDFSLSYSLFIYFGVWFKNTSEPQDAFNKKLDMYHEFFVFPA